MMEKKLTVPPEAFDRVKSLASELGRALEPICEAWPVGVPIELKIPLVVRGGKVLVDTSQIYIVGSAGLPET